MDHPLSPFRYVFSPFSSFLTENNDFDSVRSIFLEANPERYRNILMYPFGAHFRVGFPGSLCTVSRGKEKHMIRVELVML